MGESLGIAFQLVDDVLDYSARQAELGKTVGDDFREGKITLPVILAYQRASEREKIFWRRCLEDLQQDEADLEQAISLMVRHECLEECMNRARAFGATAHRALETFPDSPARQALADTVDFGLSRLY